MNLLKETENNSKICIKYKKSTLKPAVVISLSKEFNDVILIYLKQINSTTLSHVIDNSIRFSAAAVVKWKCQKEILDISVIHWNAVLGAPGII